MTQELYEWLVTFSKDNDLSISQAVRLCIRKHTGFDARPKPAAEPPKKAIDPNKVGIDGYTYAQREAILAKAKARAESGEPWEPPKPMPLPNIVRPTVKRDILSEWGGDDD